VSGGFYGMVTPVFKKRLKTGRLGAFTGVLPEEQIPIGIFTGL